MSIGQLRERPAAFYAVKGQDTPQRPPPERRLPISFFAEYAERQRR